MFRTSRRTSMSIRSLETCIILGSRSLAAHGIEKVDVRLQGRAVLSKKLNFFYIRPRLQLMGEGRREWRVKDNQGSVDARYITFVSMFLPRAATRCILCGFWAIATVHCAWSKALAYSNRLLGFDSTLDGVLDHGVLVHCFQIASPHCNIKLRLACLNTCRHR